MRRQRELEELLELGQTFAQVLPVLFPCFHKCGKFLELFDADRSLRVERLQVVADVAVDVFVIVTARQIA